MENSLHLILVRRRGRLLVRVIIKIVQEIFQGKDCSLVVVLVLLWLVQLLSRPFPSQHFTDPLVVPHGRFSFLVEPGYHIIEFDVAINEGVDQVVSLGPRFGLTIIQFDASCLKLLKILCELSLKEAVLLDLLNRAIELVLVHLIEEVLL
jgi:hypothetical protein